MSALSDMLSRLRSLEPEAALGFKPPYPPVALQISPRDAALVRVKRRRRGKPLLETHEVREISEPVIPSSIFQPVSGSTEELTKRLQELFEHSGSSR